MMMKEKQSTGLTNLQELSAGTDKQSEAEGKVLLVGENLCQLHKEAEERRGGPAGQPGYNRRPGTQRCLEYSSTSLIGVLAYLSDVS